MWRHWLNKHGSKKLHGLEYCGSQVFHALGWKPSVCVVNRVSMQTGEVQPKFWGNTHCHSPWSCPYCSPRVMAKKGENIAAAIDALAAQNQKAVMITFTMPHDGLMSCADVLSIFKETWRLFTRSGNGKKHRKQYTLRSTNQQVVYEISLKHSYGRCRHELGIKHHVKVWEFTWGPINGWHPHIHALFWIPAENFEKIIDYEADLNKYWKHSILRTAEKLFGKEYVTKHFPDWKFDWQSVTISKDKYGRPRQQTSSNYLSGWTGDKEMTCSENQKVAHEGHYTPAQILKRAYDEPENRDEWLTLYKEYAETTRGVRRVEFSKTRGEKCLNQIIREWKLSAPYKETLKKKSTDSETVLGVVVWFKESQWLQICYLERMHGYEIKSQILKFALETNGRKLIEDFLRQYDIDISANDDAWLEQLEKFLVA